MRVVGLAIASGVVRWSGRVSTAGGKLQSCVLACLCLVFCAACQQTENPPPSRPPQPFNAVGLVQVETRPWRDRAQLTLVTLTPQSEGTADVSHTLIVEHGVTELSEKKGNGRLIFNGVSATIEYDGGGVLSFVPPDEPRRSREGERIVTFGTLRSYKPVVASTHEFHAQRFAAMTARPGAPK